MADKDALTGRQKFLMNIVSGLIWPVAMMPRAALLSVGSGGGRLAFRFWKRRRRIAVANVKMIQENGFLPADLNAERVAEESFANMGRTVMESLSLYHKGFDSLAEYCRVEDGLDNFEAAKAIAAEGRGLLMVTGHMGNWEVMCRHTSRFLGRPITIVGRESGHPLADALVRRLRTGEGDSFVSKDGGAREMMKTLRTGGVLGTLIDQAVIGHNPGTPLPFMGREATTNLGPLRLAQKTDVPVLMLLFRRDGVNHYVKAMPLFKVGDFGEGEEGLTAAAAHLNQWLGERIRQYPDQWMWGHRRWKTTMGVWHNPESII